MADYRITDWKTPVFFVLAVLLVCLVSNIAGRVQGRRIGREIGFREGYEEGWAAPHPADTITRVDTLLIDRPVVVEKWKERPVLVPVRDTIRVTDSLYLALPTEVVQYADSTYRAQVSGVQPRLDWLEVYPRTQIVTERVVKDAPRWSIGITSGPGVVWDGKFHGGVGAVIGLQYRF